MAMSNGEIQQYQPIVGYFEDDKGNCTAATINLHGLIVPVFQVQFLYYKEN